MLCGGNHHEKAEAAFRLYDYNNDGVISREEMRAYLASVFKVVYLTSPETRASVGGVSAEDLAAATTDMAFAQADLNHDGKLTFDEFKRWYSTAGGQQVAEVVDSAPPWVSLAEVKRLTRLERFSSSAVFEELAVNASESGTLDKSAFVKTFKKFISDHGDVPDRDKARLKSTLGNLFAVFDRQVAVSGW